MIYEIMAGNIGEMNNKQLINYGITEEESNFRIHVFPKSNNLYLILTKELKELIKVKNYKIVSVYTNNIVTAQGYLVPIKDINYLPSTLEIPLAQSWNDIKKQIGKGDLDNSEKGFIAETVAQWSLISFFKIPFDSIKNATKDEQLKGIDFKINAETFQVKCDYNGGEKGTGNLFIQINECNPFNNK